MFDTTLLILLGLAALGFISHNTTVAISILVLIIVRVTPLNAFFPGLRNRTDRRDHYSDHRRDGAYRQRHAAALDADPLLYELEIAAGDCGRGVCFVARRARRLLMGSQPHLVAGLLVGTVLGVALFRGVPVGPLIAAGIISLFIGKS